MPPYSMNFFEPLPIKTDCSSQWGCANLQMKPPLYNELFLSLKNVASFQEMIPRKKFKYQKLLLISVFHS